MSGPEILVICLFPSLTLFSITSTEACEEYEQPGRVWVCGRVPQGRDVEQARGWGGAGWDSLRFRICKDFFTSVKLNIWPVEEKGSVVQGGGAELGAA